jgi:hypothetical protein
MGMGKEKINTEGCKLLLDALKFIGIRGRNRVPTSRNPFKLRANWDKAQNI